MTNSTNKQGVHARQVGGLWMGYYGEILICGPYMNKGMAIRQTNSYIKKNGTPGK